MDAEDARFVEREGFSYFCELNTGAVVGFLVWVRAMFGFGAVVEDTCFVEREGFSYFCELNAGSVVGFLVWMRAMFGFGAVVEELGESGFNVAWHGKLYCSFHVVPG